MQRTFAALAILLSLTAACGSDESSSTSSGSSTSTGGGEDCTPTDPKCTAVESDCIALEDNRDHDKFTLRMSQLSISKPAALADDFLSGPQGLVTKAVRLDLPECNLNGSGTFHWLLEFDKKGGKLKTGGAKSQGDGYCYVDETISSNGKGFDVAPITVDAPIEGSTFSMATPTDVIVPIYLDAAASTVVLLPLRQARIFDATLSSDQNCIGKYNAEGLDPVNLCFAEPGIDAFVNGGKLEGFVTLEEADTVIVDVRNQSMCVYLSGDSATYGEEHDPMDENPQLCKRTNGVINLKGDWCSETNSAATDSCHDAFALGAEFAASAVKNAENCP